MILFISGSSSVSTCPSGSSPPPVGASLFILGGITKLSIDKIARAALPFIIINIIMLYVLTYMPDLTLWLPRAVLR